MIRSIINYLFIACILILVSPIVFFRYFKYQIFKAEKNYLQLYKIVFFVFNRTLKFTKISFEVEGLEKLENIDDNFLVVSNHQSEFDIPIIFNVFKDFGVSFIAKKELNRFPVVSTYMKIIDCIFLDRNNVKSGMNMIKNANRLLDNGVNLCVFPEGTRSSPKNMLPFKAAALKTATRVKKNIVPVTINNSYNVMKDSWKIRSQHVQIIIHDVIKYADYKEMKINDISETVEKMIKDKVIK